ncbi:MAG TPA: HEAT repeat domain-containing protein [Pyrinomonadaceae bacterium]|nr:HEAT repeat domain-containing protein [Pyrinomonadaceae bacterium]
MRNLVSTKAPFWFVIVFLLPPVATSVYARAQSTRTLTPVQTEIEKQRERLTATDVEERRDALMKLENLHVAEASRAAVAALTDGSPIVRATAAKAVVSLDPSESVPALLPLLKDRDEFVRREAAYALGRTRSRSATAALSELLLTDKEDGVRGAAAVALGDIADEAAVISLVGTLAPELSSREKGKRKREQNVFVLRAAAVALGKIKSRAGTAALISVLGNEKLDSDVRREAARALGLIGDPSAASALRSVSTSSDPYLSQMAHEALRKLGQ